MTKKLDPREWTSTDSFFEGEIDENSAALFRKHGQFRNPFIMHVRLDDNAWAVADLSTISDYSHCILRRIGNTLYYLKYTPGSPIDKYAGGLNCAVVRWVAGKKQKIAILHSVQLAICYAWLNLQIPAQTVNDRRYLPLNIGQTYRVLTPIFKFDADEAYNNITGAKLDVEPIFEAVTITRELPDLETDDTIYDNFKRYFDEFLAQPCESVIRMGKSGSKGTLLCYPGEEILLLQKKNQICPRFLAECIRLNGYTPMVTQFPKRGAFTSDGKTRNIYPMNIKYEYVLRRFFGNRKLAPGNFTVVQGRNFPCDDAYYCYDIKQCDRKLYAYLIRFARERNLVHILIPYINGPAGPHDFGFSTNQFPSGVLHTTIVTTLFTAALMTTLGCDDGYIQGDGFMTRNLLWHDLIRFEGVNKINGFRLINGTWCYDRPERLNEYKFLRGAGPCGAMRYLITRRAYAALNANLGRNLLVCSQHIVGTGYASCRHCKTITHDGTHIMHMRDYPFFRHVSLLYASQSRVVNLVMMEHGLGRDRKSVV